MEAKMDMERAVISLNFYKGIEEQTAAVEETNESFAISTHSPSVDTLNGTSEPAPGLIRSAHPAEHYNREVIQIPLTRPSGRLKQGRIDLFHNGDRSIVLPLCITLKSAQRKAIQTISDGCNFLSKVASTH